MICGDGNNKTTEHARPSQQHDNTKGNKHAKGALTELQCSWGSYLWGLFRELPGSATVPTVPKRRKREGDDGTGPSFSTGEEVLIKGGARDDRGRWANQHEPRSLLPPQDYGQQDRKEQTTQQEQTKTLRAGSLSYTESGGQQFSVSFPGAEGARARAGVAGLQRLAVSYK